MLTVLALATASSALAQSAGDNQYADPLANGGGGGGGGQPQQQSPAPQSGGRNGSEAVSPAPTTAAPDPATSSGGPAAASQGATLPRTGADTRLLAGLGFALIAIGALGHGLPGRLRQSRG